jgi:hypothetical protein
MVGVALAVLTSRVIDVVSVYIALELIRGRLIPVLKELLFPMTGAVITALLLMNSKPFIMDQYGKYGFFILAILGVLLYLSVTYLFARVLKYEVPVLFKDMFLELYYSKARKV